MKKFITRLIIFFSIIAFIILSLNYAFIKNGKNSTSYVDFKNMPYSIDVCNFGSSHGYRGFNYIDAEANGLTCFNFALTSQSLSYDYRLLQNYKDHLNDNATVFIVISYFSFYGKGEEAGDRFLEKNERYYDILPAPLVKDCDKKAWVLNNYLPILRVNTSSIVCALFSKNQPFEEQEEIWNRKADNINLTINANEAFTRHIINNYYDDNGQRIINQDEIDALYGMIALCKDIGATPILITTPYLSEYTALIQENVPDFYDDFYSQIEKITKNTGVKYYDYAFDSRFVEKYDWFINSDHLNKEGAREFTNILMQESRSE